MATRPTRSGIKFARFYYRALQRMISEFKKIELPWHTETSDDDPVNGINRVQAAVGHTTLCAIDRGVESFSWRHFATRGEALSLARLKGFSLRRDVPASARMVGRLSGLLTAPTLLLQTGALVATKSTDSAPSVEYEHLDAAVTADATTLLVYTRKWDGGLGAFVFAAWVPGADLFSTPPVYGEAVYVGHRHLAFDTMTWAFTTPNPGTVDLSLEYTDEGYVGTPGVVTKDGGGAGTLTFNLSTFLDCSTRWRAGLDVEVTYLPTGRVATGTMGANQTVLTIGGYMGQTVPSTVSEDYQVKTTWTPIPVADVSGAAGDTLAASGPTEIVLPLTTSRTWTTDSTPGVEGFWLRFRVAKVTGGASAKPTTVDGDDGDWYLPWEATQGRTVSDELGTSTGDAWQEFALPTEPYVDGSVSEMRVGSDADWSEIETLYDADSSSKVFQVLEMDDEVIRLVTGNGTNGQIPPAGQVVRSTYRVGADQNGNAGAGTIEVQRTGVSRVAAVWNPRAASGWTYREAGTAISLEELRYVGPARVRAVQRVVTVEDYETAAQDDFMLAAGGNPVSRAIAVENGAGDQSVMLVVVGEDGTALATSDLAEMDTWFNGQQVDLQRVGGRTMAGLRCWPVNYTPEPIDVAIEIMCQPGTATGKAGAVQEALTSVLRPDATLADWKIAAGRESEVVSSDYAEWLWTLGGEVQRFRLAVVALAAAGYGAYDIATLTMDDGGGPGVANIVLTGTELPFPGTVAVTITEA